MGDTEQKELVELTMEKFESLVKGVEEKINELNAEIKTKQDTIYALNEEIAKRDAKIFEIGAKLIHLTNKEVDLTIKVNEQLKIINQLKDNPDRHLLLKLLNKGWFYRAFKSKKELVSTLYAKTSL